VKNLFYCIFISIGFLFSGLAQAALTITIPSQDADGNYTISWSGIRSYVELYEKINGSWVSINGGSITSHTVTGKPTGLYEYNLRDCFVSGSQFGTTTSCVDNFRSVQVTISAQITVDQSRSIFIRDNATLGTTGITLGGVFQKLADQLNLANPGDRVTAEQLFARMWETQKQAPGNTAIPGPKCTGVLNGFQADCRNVEGAQSNNPAGEMASYRLISLVNRFDLRDTVNFSNCGEYRMIFARTDSRRNFIIFEAQLPNPGTGSSGCAPIANFWASLSQIANANLRATNLAKFFFEGISASNVKPVIHIDNYAAATGQIRTNMFMAPVWLLKEFKISRSGLNLIVPVSVKSNPFGGLFSASRTDALAVNFRSSFLANLPTIIKDRDTFFLNVSSDTFNNGESHASGDIFENDFSDQTSAQTNAQFKANIQSRLTALGSSLTPDHVINRAEAMTCGGCHQPRDFGLTANNTIAPGISWPDTLGFVHVSEFLGSDGNFPISPALINVFLPARKKDFESYLNNSGSSSNSAAAQKTSAPASSTSITGKRSG
jgi:hypothetical protein